MVIFHSYVKVYQRVNGMIIGYIWDIWDYYGIYGIIKVLMISMGNP